MLGATVGFTKLTYDLSVDLATDSCTQDESQVIESDELSLEYTDISDSTVWFNLTDKVTGESNPVGFSIRYYQSYSLSE